MSFSILWEDFRERILNYDNTFLTTFIHLISKPEQVIGGYISGMRKRYMDPLSYLGIALTLSGIQLFIIRKADDKLNWDVYYQELSPELISKVSEIGFDYSSFMFLGFIPVFTFISWPVFNRRDYLFSECLILFAYVLAHWSILLFIPILLLLLLAPNYYIAAASPLLLVMMAYSIFSLQRIHNYPLPKFMVRAIVYLMLAFLGYLMVIGIFYALLFATGTISLSDFVPPK